MSEDTTTDAPTLRFPAPVAHSLDMMCRQGECSTCAHNIASQTLLELQALNELLRPFAQMATTRMGLVRGMTKRG